MDISFGEQADSWSWQFARVAMAASAGVSRVSHTARRWRSCSCVRRERQSARELAARSRALERLADACWRVCRVRAARRLRCRRTVPSIPFSCSRRPGSTRATRQPPPRRRAPAGSPARRRGVRPITSTRSVPLVAAIERDGPTCQDAGAQPCRGGRARARARGVCARNDAGDHYVRLRRPGRSPNSSPMARAKSRY